jgi:pimeloyl-ACP methyl ester carboxylesterase
VVRELLVGARAAELSLERNAEMEAKTIVLGERSLRWTETSFGEAAAGSRSLWISMHGGGGAPSEVNDQQWKNQGGLYQPAEGFYVAPRAPTDTWNLWHEAHIDPLFARLIEDFVVLRGVDPDRVYLMGYSAGGDGVWQLAPRMADRFAAAAMMAGHPNEASLLSLRNLPFAIFMGADDAAYERNKVARERGEQLDALHAADAAGYEHLVRIYEGLGHWMKRKDAEALPWMAERKRVAWPNKIVWFQDDVVHERFYWLARAPGSARAGEVDGRTIRVSANGLREFCLLLDDALLDLDLPITVEVDGQPRFEGRVERNAPALWGSLQERFDPAQAACVRLELKW